MRRSAVHRVIAAGILVLGTGIGAPALAGTPMRIPGRGRMRIDAGKAHVTVNASRPNRGKRPKAAPDKAKPDEPEAPNAKRGLRGGHKGKAKDAKAGPNKAARLQLTPIERAKRGVVHITRKGKVVGMGTVLNRDGRILTALSPLSDGNGLKLRYADGTTVPARVGHSDRVWDLALLVPQVGKWKQGLAPSRKDPLKQGNKLRSFTPGKKLPQAATLVLDSRRSLLGADSQLLRDVFHVTTRVGRKELGSPIVDEQGNVVALLGRACMPVKGGPCAPTAFGIPTDAIRAFLRRAPKHALRPAPWLGLKGMSESKGPVKGVRVLSVSPKGPADAAGLRGPTKKDPNGGDVVVALNGHSVQNPKQLGDMVRKQAVGEKVDLLVFRNGKFKTITSVLRKWPDKHPAAAKKPRRRKARRSMPDRTRPPELR